MMRTVWYLTPVICAILPSDKPCELCKCKMWSLSSRVRSLLNSLGAIILSTFEIYLDAFARGAALALASFGNPSDSFELTLVVTHKLNGLVLSSLPLEILAVVPSSE